MNNYDIAVFRLFWDSFKKINGAWCILLSASILMFVLQMLLVDLPDYYFDEQVKTSVVFFLGSLVGLIFIIMPLNAGLWMLGIQRIEHHQVKFKDLFIYWRGRYICKLLLLVAWFLIRAALPILILVTLLLYAASFFDLSYESGIFWACAAVIALMGIYLCFRYMFAMPLAFKQNVSTWQAMTVAGKAFDQHGFKLTCLFSMQYFVIFVFSLLFGLFGFLWVIGLVIVLFTPWCITLYGMVYHKMFISSEVSNVRS